MLLKARLTPHLRLKVFSLLDSDRLFKLRELNHATYRGTYGISESGFVHEDREIMIKVRVKNGNCLMEEKSLYASCLRYYFSMGNSIQIKLEADVDVVCHTAE